MGITSIDEIISFVTIINNTNLDDLVFIKRDKNLATLSQLGLTSKDAKEIAQSIKINDYRKGPEPERDPLQPPGEIWTFKKKIESETIYIKIKLQKENGLLKLLSFHIDE